MSTTTLYTYRPSPVGTLQLVSDGGELTGLYLEHEKRRPQPESHWRRDDRHFHRAVEQLDAYFSGDRVTFDLPIQLSGTEFQRGVWNELLRIPFGRTATYADIAMRIGKPTAVRAVGAANGRNPLAIVVPCHRIVGSDGSLTGYAGGLECKAWLLRHEAATVADGHRPSDWRLVQTT